MTAVLAHCVDSLSGASVLYDAAFKAVDFSVRDMDSLLTVVSDTFYCWKTKMHHSRSLFVIEVMLWWRQSPRLRNDYTVSSGTLNSTIPYEGSHHLVDRAGHSLTMWCYYVIISSLGSIIYIYIYIYIYYLVHFISTFRWPFVLDFQHCLLFQFSRNYGYSPAFI